MKKIIALIILILCQTSMVLAYELTQRKNYGKSLVSYKINDATKEIAQIYLLDPENKFHFFSNDKDPLLFNDLNNKTDSIAKERQIIPNYMLLADFSDPAFAHKKFSLNHLWYDLGIMIYAPDYLGKVNLLNPKNIATRFFISLKMGQKEFYGIVIFNQETEAKEAEKIIKNLKNIKQNEFNICSLLNFPIALISFNDGKTDTVYESSKKVKKYTCLFITGQ